jgi:hypothetical protein
MDTRTSFIGIAGEPIFALGDELSTGKSAVRAPIRLSSLLDCTRGVIESPRSSLRGSEIHVAGIV